MPTTWNWQRRPGIIVLWMGIVVLGTSCRIDAQEDLADQGLRQFEATEAALKRAIERVRPSVASVYLRDVGSGVATEPGLLNPGARSPREPQPASFGTGIILRKEGILATCYHVVRGALDAGAGLAIEVQLHDGSRYPATIYAADPRSDLATLQLRTSQPLNLQPIAIGDGSKLFAGQFVVAIGNPFGVASPDGSTSASLGIISNIRRGADLYYAGEKPTIEMHGRTLVQTDARLNMGSSGCALVNLRGELVGVGMAISASIGFESPGGFAQPTDALTRRILETLAEGKEMEYGFIGISLPREQFVGPEGSPAGVIVPSVESPAARQAGLEPHDMIVEVNGQRVRNQHDLVLLVGSLPAGSKLHTKVIRGGAVKELVIPLGKYPVYEEPIVTNKRPEWNGIRVDYLSVLVRAEGNPWGEERRYPDCGVVVREVRPGSPADKKGVQRDQIIERVNGTRIFDPNEFDEMVAKAVGPVRLTFSHDVEQVFEARENNSDRP